MSEHIAVVGAGVGGLAVACRLAKKGYSVEVFEKLSKCGGRAHIIEDRGFKIDTGPSFVMMPDFFNEFFESCGKNLTDYLNLKVLDAHYKLFYPDGTKFTVYSDCARTEEELEKIEPGSAKAFRKFLDETGLIYKSVEPLLYRMFTPASLFNPKYWNLLSRLKVGKTYWDLAKKYFRSETLCYAFTFEAMFMGVSPFKTPAFYSVISYADHVQKISHPMGGMYQIPLALEKICKETGVKINYDSEITAIETKNNRIYLKRGKNTIDAKKIVINADLSYAQTKLLKRKLPDYLYSCSVFLIYWGLKKKIPNLEHHNLFFAQNLPQNMDNIFKLGKHSSDFSFYIHVPTKTDPALAPQGKDILYCLVPVPNLKITNGNVFSDYEAEVKKAIINRLKRVCSMDIDPLIEVEHKFYPVDFIKRYNIEYGATFGLSHTFGQSAFFRPPNQDKRVKNVYYVGASTQPGGGLPPVLASSRIVADIITNQS